MTRTITIKELNKMTLSTYIRNRSEITSRKVHDNLIILTTKNGLTLCAYLKAFNLLNLNALCDVI